MNLESLRPILLTLVTSVFLLTACEKSATETAENAEPRSPETASAEQQAVLKEQVENAKKTTKVFVSSLKGELQKAMKAGGPVNALSVCNKEAIPITEKVAKEQGSKLSRVSLKNRNPGNKPDDWQKVVLEDFDTRAANGEDVKTMAFAKIVEDGGKKQFRFMKAIPTGKPCLSCHGSQLDPKVSAKLAELYPEDKATGYKLGQVRGAVVIINDL